MIAPPFGLFVSLIGRWLWEGFQECSYLNGSVGIVSGRGYLFVRWRSVMGLHRRAVRQALAAALPPERKRPVGRPAGKLVRYRELIDSWLVADRRAPCKQRHTAKRVWERLTQEHGVDVSVRTVAYWVAARRREFALSGLGMVPLVHDPGVEAEVDWGEAQVVLAGQVTNVHLFHMRACHSGAAFVMAFGRETQQAYR